MRRKYRKKVPAVVMTLALGLGNTACSGMSFTEHLLGVPVYAEQTSFLETYVSASGLPIYEVTDFLRKLMDMTVVVNVPASWGNNESGRAMTSYSPVNASGAISPSAGTLSLSYYPMTAGDAAAEFDLYESNIASMSVTSNVTSEDVTAAGLSARKVDFWMTVGANVFECETICFLYGETVYAIEIMQGQQTQYDYYPAYYQVVDSAQVGSEELIAEVLSDGAAEDTPLDDDDTWESQNAVIYGDLSTFQYAIGGNVYAFPTRVDQGSGSDLHLNFDLVLPYDLHSDLDMNGAVWTELVNTEYYYFENSIYKEMVGVTNTAGYPISMVEGTITAMIDTYGEALSLTLPGGIQVGSQETALFDAFPDFWNTELDGLAHFRGNELLYARNVRDDGCNGYVLIKNDAPYYSTVSIICEYGIIKEISFECLGTERAQGVFL